MSTRMLPVMALLGIVCIMLLSVITPAFSTTYYVQLAGADSNDGLTWNNAKRTVQAAINAAKDGDDVRVAAGTYVENITLKNGVYLRGGYAVGGTASDPATNVTILDGYGSGSVVTVAEGALCDPMFETGTVIDGFTIQNGRAQYGGGINCSWQSAPLIKNNTITGNIATICGGGISCWESSSAYIRKNILTNNTASLENGGGGGIYATVSSHPEITGNTFRYNSAFYGGAIDCYWVSSGYIADNIIRNNTAVYGGAIYQGYTTASVDYNHIYKNTAQYGGAIYCFESFSFSSIMHNRIYGNGAMNGGGVCLDGGTITWFYNNRIFGNGSRNGGGIYSRRSSPNVANNTIAGNSATEEGGGLYLSGGSPQISNNIISFGYSGVFNDGTSNPNFQNNCVSYNSEGHIYDNGYNYKGMTDPTGANGNISADPWFTYDTFGDFHLRYYVDQKSPCIDKGNNSAPGIPNGAVDMDGDARFTSKTNENKHWEPVLTTIPTDASAPQENIIDIGADEVLVMADDNTPDPVEGEEEPDPFWVYTYATWAASYRPLYVAPDGADTNTGSSWTLTKRSILAAVEDAAALPTILPGDPANSNPRDDIRPPINDVSWLFQFYGSSTFGGVIRVKGDPNEPYTGSVELSPHVYVFGGYPASEPAPGDNLRDFRKNPTIIDALGIGSAVRSLGGFMYSQLDGFTLRNGVGTADWYGNTRGGGIFCDYSGLSLVDVTITSNTANYGGGVYCNDSTPWLQNAAITENKSTATDGGGGGMHLKSSIPTLWSSVILGNSGVYGGGIQCIENAHPWLVGNTITGNSANYGGGIHSQSSAFNLVNSIVAFNSSGIMSSGATPLLNSNCIYGNTSFNYNGVADPTGRDGNISLDPMLFISRGNVHIQPQSPCRDAGNTSYAEVVVGWTDMDHQQRIFPDGGVTDIGADESDGTSWNTQRRIVRVSTSGNDGNDGSSWASAVRHIQTAIDILTPEGGEVWVRAGIYDENILVTQRVFIYGGFKGTEATRVQRNAAANTCMINGGQDGSVVRFINTGYKQSGIDGFTITNGSGTWENNIEAGGGIYCSNGSPIISNNIIIDNYAVLGAGIYCFSSVPDIINNIIRENEASAGVGTNTYGGGIFLNSYSSARVINNTIVDNDALYGGGISCKDSSPVVLNNIVVDGSSGIYASPGSNPTVNYNCVFDNDSYNYSGVNAGANDISLDPLFVDAANDNYHIQPLSPCLDAGDSSVVDVGWTDIDVEARIYGDKVDIGADESYSVELPVFNPDGGSFPAPQSVTITCPTPGAVIRYTTNGSNPTTSSPAVNGPVVVDRNLTLKARAYVNGLRPSGVKSADFKIALAEPSFSPDSGTYDYSVNVIVTCASSDVTIHYTLNGNDPVQTDPVVTSGSSVLIYKTTTLKARAYKNGWEPSPVKTGDYVITAVALPFFTPDGGTFAAAQNVTVTCDTPGAVIHYTTNGKDPTEADPVIASGSSITVDRSLTLKARAWKAGQTVSGIKSAVYTITGNKVIYVKPAGSDLNSGLTWTAAKKTIQAGLNAAANGDEVWVLKGEYKECITLKTGVALYGGFDGSESLRNERDWKVNVTIIDGNKAGSVVTTPAGAVATTIIDGFTIRNGIGTLLEASRYGGGIYCLNSSPMIANNTITGNTAYAGAGIYCRNASPVTLNNIITRNTSQSTGAGICCIDSSPSIANNVVAGNTINEGHGGGIYVAAAVTTGSLPTISNNIIAFNSSGIYRHSGKPVMVSNCVFGNTKYDYLGLDAGSADVRADPKFLDFAEGDFHITIDSPCRDAGDDSAVQPGALDMDLQPRIYGTHVDIGVDEWRASNPVNVSLSPNNGALGKGQPVIIASTFTDNDGPANLANCYMLVNTTFSGAKACYVMYDANDNKLYLRNDANSAWIGGFLVGSQNILENSYCKLYCAGTTVSVTGAKLKVNWKLELKSAFTGTTCYGWLLCVDDTNLRDDWDRMGAYNVSQCPTNTSLSPASAVVSPQVKQTLVVKYSDGDGCTDVSRCYTLINTTLTGTRACYLYYDAAADKLYVRNDSNTAWVGGYAPWSAYVVENSYFKLYCAETAVSKSGTYITISYRIEFKSSFSGRSCSSWLMVQDRSGLRDDWERLGSLRISTAPSVLGFAPASATLSTGAQCSWTSRFSDADGYSSITDCYTLINTGFSGANAAYLRYDSKNNRLYVRNDANTGWLGGYAPGSANVIENSSCRLYCASTTKSGTGTGLVVNWKVMIKSNMSGKSLGVWQKLYDEAGLYDGWDRNATLTVQ